MSLDVVVWGTGNMGRAAIRSVVEHPALELVGVVVSTASKVGIDAGELAGLGRDVGVAATDDPGRVIGGADAVAYMASGDLRPDDALADLAQCLRAGCTVVTPSSYPLYDPASAPAEIVDPIRDATDAGGSRLFVSGVDPGWGNDLLPALMAGMCTDIRTVRAQELFDYSTYDAPDTVRYIIGFGESMEYEPPMIAPTIPASVWGCSVRLIARALGVEVDEITEFVERRPLERTVTNALGTFETGTQGALRFEVRGVVDGAVRIVIEHVTRIDPECAPDWPTPPDGVGAHRVLIEANPDLEVTVKAVTDGSNAAGGNATAANRLVGAIPWLAGQPPGLYDSLDVPLQLPVDRLSAGA